LILHILKDRGVAVAEAVGAAYLREHAARTHGQAAA
jgi:hypothetical protein